MVGFLYSKLAWAHGHGALGCFALILVQLSYKDMLLEVGTLKKLFIRFYELGAGKQQFFGDLRGGVLLSESHCQSGSHSLAAHPPNRYS